MLLHGTKAGAATHPDSYFNLKANPQITVGFGGESFRANLLQLPMAEAERRVRSHAESTPQLAQSVSSAAPRVIPVFSINRI
jgi:hypothetical protein